MYPSINNQWYIGKHLEGEGVGFVLKLPFILHLLQKEQVLYDYKPFKMIKGTSRGPEAL